MSPTALHGFSQVPVTTMTMGACVASRSWFILRPSASKCGRRFAAISHRRGCCTFATAAGQCAGPTWSVLTEHGNISINASNRSVPSPNSSHSFHIQPARLNASLLFSALKHIHSPYVLVNMASLHSPGTRLVFFNERETLQSKRDAPNLPNIDRILRTRNPSSQIRRHVSAYLTDGIGILEHK
jgi:hypothetical protein